MKYIKRLNQLKKGDTPNKLNAIEKLNNMKDDEESVKTKAAKTLNKITLKDPADAVPHLWRVLKNPRVELSVKQRVASSLVQIGSNLQNTPVKSEIVRALALVAPSLPKYPHPDVVMHAVDAAFNREIDETNAQLFAETLNAVVNWKPAGEILAKHFSEDAEALKCVVPHFRKDEDPRVVRCALVDALQGRINEYNALRHIEKLREPKGKLNKLSQFIDRELKLRRAKRFRPNRL